MTRKHQDHTLSGAKLLSDKADSRQCARLPNLIIWFRETLENNDVDVPEYFGWTEEWAEEFYSWGHNSRWANVFASWLEPDDIEEYLEEILDIARTFGDPNVDDE